MNSVNGAAKIGGDATFEHRNEITN